MFQNFLFTIKIVSRCATNSHTYDHFTICSSCWVLTLGWTLSIIVHFVAYINFTEFVLGSLNLLKILENFCPLGWPCSLTPWPEIDGKLCFSWLPKRACSISLKKPKLARYPVQRWILSDKSCDSFIIRCLVSVLQVVVCIYTWCLIHGAGDLV